MSNITQLPIAASASIDPRNWQEAGACREMDTELFFHPEGERGSTRRRRAENAKAICATCPVMQQCREYALSIQEPYGIWGGMSEEERREYLVANRKSRTA